MADTTNYAKHQKLTYEDIADLLIVPLRTAERYLNDIKKEYDLKIVTYQHYCKYFNLE